MKVADRLKGLNSGELIEDPAAICERLLSAQDKVLADKASGDVPQTVVWRDGEGRARVKKRAGDALVKSAKAMTEEQLRELAAARDIPWDESYKDRVVAYWLSDERVDGHGDITLQNWIFDDFENNPVLVYDHMWELPPIGAALDWTVQTRKDGQYSGPALRTLSLFATADQWEWAGTVFNLVKARVPPRRVSGVHAREADLDRGQGRARRARPWAVGLHPRQEQDLGALGHDARCQPGRVVDPPDGEAEGLGEAKASR